MLKQRDTIPAALFDARPEQIHGIFPEPTLIHLPGKNPEPLFVSVMLHGNEPVGFFALIALLKKYREQTLPRALSLFFGNTLAASQGLRRLEHQPDFNRVWPGTALPACDETRMTQNIVDIMQARRVFASIDIHNNTGLNPHYACINRLEPDFLQLALLFNRLVVYFTHPKGVQSAAFAKLCPAVTLECGRPGQSLGIDHAFEFLNSCLHLTTLPAHTIQAHDIDLFHTVAQIKIRDSISFSFENNETDLLLNSDLERLNFNEIPSGTIFGQVNSNRIFPIVAYNDQGQDVSSDFFSVDNQQLQIIRPSMPSMLTLDEQVIRQDCLCYLMERIRQ